MEAVINDYVSGELVQDQFSVVMDDVDVVREHFAAWTPSVPICGPGAWRVRQVLVAEAARAAGAVGRLLRKAEASAYWLALAPLAAFLPARLAYRVACWRGDWTSRSRPEKHSEFTANLRQLLGEELSPEGADRVARDIFRFMSCEAIDVMRLRGRGRSLSKLVEIRAASTWRPRWLAARGPSCAAPLQFPRHYLLGAPCQRGFRSPPSGAGVEVRHRGVFYERRLWEFVYARRLLRHCSSGRESNRGRAGSGSRCRPRPRSAPMRVVSISSDTPPLHDDRPRAVGGALSSAGKPCSCRGS